ncbi:unnamed protein product [Toxocara canis]|uniref:Protein transport protein sec16 n=1 Tax=Toxocara canis TaxID=6265 RepID=A0A183VBS2_TOXCA|nr:unnamed protein product [Toxocara canis]
MSHFFWQSALQSAQQQQQPMESGTASQNDGNWSNIGLVGGAEHERQQWPLQNTQYSELGADPYSAAVFQSYNNSASGYQFAHPQSQSQQYGNGNHQNNFYGAAEEDAQALYHNQMSAGITTCEHGLMNACENVAGMVSNSQSAKQQQFQQAGATISGTNHPQQSFGIHEPILPEPRSPVESVNQAENVLYNAVKRDSVDSRSASSKGWSVEREQSSSVETQVPDLLNIGEMASKGSASCEMIVEKKDEAICALSNVPVDADFRPHEGTSSVNQHSRGDMVQVQNREAGSISGAGNVTEQQPLVEECAPAFSATVNSTEQRVAYGAEAGKQADQVKSVQRGVEGSEKIVSVPGEAANIMPHAEVSSGYLNSSFSERRLDLESGRMSQRLMLQPNSELHVFGS